MTENTVLEVPRFEEPTAAITAMNSVKWRIAGDVIARTCESLPDHQRREIKWLSGYARERNLDCAEIGLLLQQPGTDRPYSGDSVYAACTGRRDEGSLDRFCESVSALRRRVEETTPRSKTLFIETSLTRKIWRTCRTAFERQKMTFIFGASQIGKTTAISEYATAHNHGETVLVRMPTRGSMTDFLEEMAIRLGISPQTKTKELRRRIIESFDSRTLLIVDECHECMRSNYSDRALATLDFIREIYDRRKCGVVLCGTDVFRVGLRTNKILKQLWLRGYRPLMLPATPSDQNLAQFAGAFGLEPAEDKNITVEVTDVDDNGQETVEKIRNNPLKLQQLVVAGWGLGRWLSILEDAADAAREKRARVTWGRVIAAHHAIQQMESAK